MAEREILLETREVSKWYRSGTSRVVVLDRVSLDLRDGEITCLLGASGSGKTTFLRIIAGLVEPSDGQILRHGVPLQGVNADVSIVFQSFALFPWMTVLENVKLGLVSSGMDRKKAIEKALRTIDMIGLDGFEDAYPRELSGGMKQRVGFARAWVMEPELLCMDEPFSGLDVLTAENLRGELLDLWNERKLPTRGMFMVTHNIEEAVTMADRVVILSHNPGRTMADMRIPLSHPRNSKSPAFKRLVDQIYTTLARPSEADAAGRHRPLALRTLQKLPHARLGALTGLLELVLEQGGRKDIYHLEGELNLQADDLLPLTEAACILRLAEVREGDICMTALGRRFADGTILERKEVFRDAAASSVVLISQILHALNAAKRHEMDEAFFLELLENHFTGEEAERQLETAIDWGRYAELFSYDEDSGLLYLEKEEPPATDDEPAESAAADPDA
jgi:NitT/TauT family transport system ATP-binding protein